MHFFSLSVQAFEKKKSYFLFIGEEGGVFEPLETFFYGSPYLKLKKNLIYVTILINSEMLINQEEHVADGERDQPGQPRAHQLETGRSKHYDSRIA